MAKQTLITHTARCNDCGAECFKPNARDWAHDHANRNKGHLVVVDLRLEVISANLESKINV